MSSLYRLRFLDVSIALWVILALNGLASGCGGEGKSEHFADLDRGLPAPIFIDP